MFMNRRCTFQSDRLGVAGTAARQIGPRSRRRRGMSLMVVMVVISVSVVLTLSFVRTQTTNLQIHHNTSGLDSARSAAQTGAAVALREIGSADWAGIDVGLSATVHSDTTGDTSYSVEYLPLDESRMSPLPDGAALHLVVKSTGRWQSRDNANDFVERIVEVIVQLEPRVPGRTIHPGDSATATDLLPNPGTYDSIQQYALFAHSGATSLILDPEDRVEGNVWLQAVLQLYDDPHWDSNVRAGYLSSVGTNLVKNGAFVHPHPLSGQITFRTSPTSSVVNALQRLNVPWTTTAQTPSVPAVDYTAWTTYQLYEGGPTYSAQPVDSYLRSVTLRPTAENPLGIFYYNGAVQISDDVMIQGTLVASGTVTITGENARLCAYNWKGDAGRSLVSNAELWPRLPAIVANKVSVDRNIRTAIEGAIVVATSLDGAGGDFAYFSIANVNISGTALSTPVQQPWSTVHLQESVSLASVDGSGNYEIWLQDGTSGGWFTIVDVDSANRKLKVLGEVSHDSPVAYRIRRGRYRFFDVRGPICGATFNINRPPSWDTPTAGDWDNLWGDWQSANSDNSSIQFVDWLAKPINFDDDDGWVYPHTTYGLPLEPTFHARNTTGIHYLWSPPLFRSYAGTGDEEQYAGYRWRVVSWRHVP